MPTSCRTHDYDGELRQKWFAMRPMLLEQHLPKCRSFSETLADIERWLNEKYYNVKRIGRARRALDILRSERRGNFDSKNDINVEELLPILWHMVKDQTDIHNTFYEQLCDITGGSCSQGRSTRLFQFLFLFDLPTQASASASTTEDAQGEKPPIAQTTVEETQEDTPDKTSTSTAARGETQEDKLSASATVVDETQREKSLEQEPVAGVIERSEETKFNHSIPETHQEPGDASTRTDNNQHE